MIFLFAEFSCLFQQSVGCVSEGEVISCFFVQDRKFTIAKITIAMSGDRLAGGESGMAVLPLNYRLTWANIEKEGEGVEEDNDQIVIQYEAQLNVSFTLVKC